MINKCRDSQIILTLMFFLFSVSSNACDNCSSCSNLTYSYTAEYSGSNCSSGNNNCGNHFVCQKSEGCDEHCATKSATLNIQNLNAPVTIKIPSH